MSSITVPELALWQRGDFDFLLLDVRRARARTEDGSQIPGSTWRDPALWLDWKDGIGNQQPVVVYCVHGHEISQGLTAALRAMGVDARHLDGGIAGWKVAGHAVQPCPG